MSLESEQTSSSRLSDVAYWKSVLEDQQQENTPPTEVSPDNGPPARTARQGQYPWSNGQTPAYSISWQLALEAYESDRPLDLPVIGFNKGGVLVRWNDLQGFVPASHLVHSDNVHLPEERLRELASRRGTEMCLKIIEIDPKINRLVLSERAALVGAEQRLTLLQQTRSGEVVRGQITNLTHFGAFVDLGGIEGLVHKSEISWSLVKHPSQYVHPGQDVQALVLSVDRERGRVALSLKQLRPDPWRDVENRYQVGDLVNGVISRVVSFGAFVRLEAELEGLIHSTELAEGSFLHPRNVVHAGQTVCVRVLLVNGENKKLSLSLRGANHPNNGDSA